MDNPFWEEWLEEKQTYNINNLPDPWGAERRRRIRNMSWLDRWFINLLMKVFYRRQRK